MTEEARKPTPEEWHAFVYQRVPSFYGPGNFACWLLTVASVFVTWTLNPAHRRSDVLGADFIAMITYPTIAAIDAATKLTRYPFKRGDSLDLVDWFRRDPEEWLYTEAIRAPIAICVRFCEFGAGLLVIMAFWTKPRTIREIPLKRGLFLSIFWTLCAGVKLAEIHMGPIFIEGKGPPEGLLWIFNRHYPSLLKYHVEEATRYCSTLAVVLLTQFLACGGSALLGLVIRIRIRDKVPGPPLDREPTDVDKVQFCGDFMLFVGGSWGASWGMFLALARLATFFMGDRSYAPQTTTEMVELDQVAAVLGGVIALVWSMKDAAMEWRHRKQD